MNRPSLTSCFGCYLLTLLLVAPLLGCRNTQDQLPPKQPRPVNVMTLSTTTPEGTYMVSGAVQSWKTEQIGFEVQGRVLWVLEPGRDVEGKMVGEGDLFVKEGTEIAQIDPARYNVAVESAEANRTVATLTQKSVQIRVEEALAAELESATTDWELADSDLKRLQELAAGNAVSEADLDQARAREQTQRSRVRSIEAQRDQARAELESATAQVIVATQDLLDAKRDKDNTTLYSSFHGRVSEVHVVPGSVVNVGDPVLTLQMMNPIKIEVEVSADKSREVRRRSQIPVTFKLPSDPNVPGTQNETINAFVYNVDNSADPTTRTFSLTLLMKNEKIPAPLSSEAVAANAIRAEGVWPLRINSIIGAKEDVFVVEEKSIYSDSNGDFVYQVTNAEMGKPFPEVLNVVARPIQKEDRWISFLGIWTFYEVQFLDDLPVNELTLVAGELDENDLITTQWQGESIVLDPGDQWALRPGDLVRVNLSGEKLHTGFYVPATALYADSGQMWIFAVEGDTVKKLAVDALLNEPLTNGPLVEIRSEELRDGMTVVTEGVHFLVDGEKVRVVNSDNDLQPIGE